MKKLFYFCAIAFIMLSSTGCSSLEEEISSDTVECQFVKSDKFNMSDGENIAIGYRNFLHSVDSLNKSYVSLSPRGFWSGAATGGADAAGGLIGASCGGWLGGALGSLTGNPAGTVIGVAVGRRFGPVVFAAAASGLAELFVSASVPGHGSLGLLDGPTFDFGILSDEGGLSDSIGYYHNKLVYEICKNKSNYISGTNVDGYNVCSDIVDMCKAYGFDMDVLATTDAIKIVTSVSEELAKISVKYYKGEISSCEFTSEQLRVMEDGCGLTDFDYSLYKEYVSPLIFKCAELDMLELQNYSKSLGQIIYESKIDKDLKHKISVVSQITINSALCWK